MYQFLKDTAASCEYLSRDVNARTVISNQKAANPSEKPGLAAFEYRTNKETAIRCEHLQREFISLLISRKEKCVCMYKI